MHLYAENLVLQITSSCLSNVIAPIAEYSAVRSKLIIGFYLIVADINGLILLCWCDVTVFKYLFVQVSWVLEQHEPSSSSDDLTAVRNHTDQMLCLLADEQPSESSDGDGTVPNMGPILELVVRKNILERLLHWHLRRGLDSESQGALLKLFEMLIGQSQQPLLQHSAVLHPLLRLLGACAEPEVGCPAALENSLVLLLNQVC